MYGGGYSFSEHHMAAMKALSVTAALNPMIGMRIINPNFLFFSGSP